MTRIRCAGDDQTCSHCLQMDGLEPEELLFPPFIGCASLNGCRCVVVDEEQLPVKE